VSDCTQVVLDAIETTWDFFMSEKKSKGSHYKAIVMQHFTQLGVGVSIDPAKKRYYLVVHYGVEPL
jgi:hypothetical protein